MVRKGIWEVVPCQCLFMSHISSANFDTVCKSTKLLLEEKHDNTVLLILMSFKLVSATADNWVVPDGFVSFWFLFLPAHTIFENLSFLLCSVVVVILSILEKKKPKQNQTNQPKWVSLFKAICSRVLLYTSFRILNMLKMQANICVQAFLFV